MHKILLLGSGALKIGEAGEFDYSGTQAIKALKEEGKEVILVNPNVATIQTSEGLADKVYFLPVTPQFVEKVIQQERPDSILLSFGGQTALNCGMALHKEGILKKYHVEILGTPIEAIHATEDRDAFSKRLARLNLPTAKGKTVTTVPDALTYATSLGYPVMVRAGFALGGTGSGIAKNEKELTAIATRALAATAQIIIEESLFGWKELEYEVVRDKDDNCITVCNMENFDPVGIHTGESIVVAPSQTLNDREYYMLRQASIDVIRELKIVGECNIQFALHPTSEKFRIIEVNARLSRSSALASKATGYPLAYIAAKLALGNTLPNLRNKVTETTSAFFEPALDYIVVKIPRWDIEKFPWAAKNIGSEMKSVGEVMSIGRTFEEAIQKGARMLNDGYEGVIDKRFGNESKKTLIKSLTRSDSMRLFTVCSAIRAGISISIIHKKTHIDKWFLHKLAGIVETYKELDRSDELSKSLLYKAKKEGFADKQIADIFHILEKTVRTKRIGFGIHVYIKRIDTMAGEFPARPAYFYCTYNASHSDHTPNHAEKRVMVLGCGPYAIGTSVEFDWCAVTASQTVREEGRKSIMVNCNPETVSTDYDMSDYLYFEELTLERVLDICDIEKVPVIVSMGGQIPNNISSELAAKGIEILGTHPSIIYKAEHREQFSKLLDSLGIAQPAWVKANTIKRALSFALSAGYPVLVRPSFVLSGKAMSVIASDVELVDYMNTSTLDFARYPLVMTKFLDLSKECDVDGVAQQGEIVAMTVSEHVEGGGVHSGDSTLLLPPVTFSGMLTRILEETTGAIVKALGIHGPFNIQFLVVGNTPFVIECNVRASRSFPFVSKMTGVNFVRLSIQIALDKHVTKHDTTIHGFQAIKAPQFSFHKLREADPVLRVEMGSTGEVCAQGNTPEEAYLKAILATGIAYPTKKAAFVSLGGLQGKIQGLFSCQMLAKAGFTLYATTGTSFFLKDHGITTTLVHKIHEGIKMTIVELLDSRAIDIAIVIPEQSNAAYVVNPGTVSDGYLIRRRAVDRGIPVVTQVEAAEFLVRAITRYTPDTVQILPSAAYLSKKHL